MSLYAVRETIRDQLLTLPDIKRGFTFPLAPADIRPYDAEVCQARAGRKLTPNKQLSHINIKVYLHTAATTSSYAQLEEEIDRLCGLSPSGIMPNLEGMGVEIDEDGIEVMYMHDPATGRVMFTCLDLDVRVASPNL